MSVEIVCDRCGYTEIIAPDHQETVENMVFVMNFGIDDGDVICQRCGEEMSEGSKTDE